MLRKVYFFLKMIVSNGFGALIVSLAFFILFAFAMIPVSIILGDGVASKITTFVGGNFLFKFIYTVVFISMVMNDLGIPNVKTILRRL